MIRVNIIAAGGDWKQHPKWFNELLTDAIKTFQQDWQITYEDVIKWVYADGGEKGCHRLAEILRCAGVEVLAYHRTDLPSWGVQLDETQPIVVEYKLKCTGTADEV